MQNITPEDRHRWDKAMADHQKRLKKKPSGPLRGILIAICAIIVAGILIALVTARYFPNPEQRDPETILNDTLQLNAGDISRTVDSCYDEGDSVHFEINGKWHVAFIPPSVPADSSLYEMKKTDAGREYDSLTRGSITIDTPQHALLNREQEDSMDRLPTVIYGDHLTELPTITDPELGHRIKVVLHHWHGKDTTYYITGKGRDSL